MPLLVGARADRCQRHVTHGERHASGARNAVADRDAARIAIGVALGDFIVVPLR